MQWTMDIRAAFWPHFGYGSALLLTNTTNSWLFFFVCLFLLTYCHFLGGGRGWWSQCSCDVTKFWFRGNFFLFVTPPPSIPWNLERKKKKKKFEFLPWGASFDNSLSPSFCICQFDNCSLSLSEESQLYFGISILQGNEKKNSPTIIHVCRNCPTFWQFPYLHFFI